MASVMTVVALWGTVAIAGVNEDLIEAAKRDHLAGVKGLVGKGADVNAKNKDGYTALMTASQNGQRDVGELLIKAGAK